MSQDISITGSRSPFTVDSDNLRQQDEAVSLAGEALVDAPPLLESTLDNAREMNSVPERDIPEEVLSRRNEETGETVAGRTLASALEKNDAPSMDEAAKKLQGRAFTAQMESMLEQAGMSVSTESSAQAEAVSYVGEKKSAEHAAELTLDMKVPWEIFTVLKDVKPGLLFPRDLPLKEMQEYGARLDALIENIPVEKEEQGSEHTVLLAQLMKCRIQLSNSITSRTNLEARLEDLNRVKESDGSPARKLESFVDFALTWQNGLEQTNALLQMEAGNPQYLQQALNGTGLGIVGHDLDTLEGSIIDAMVEQLELLQAEGKDKLGEEALKNLARLSLRAGERPAVMLDMLQKGLAWASSAEHRNALVNALASGVAATGTEEGRKDAALRGETLRYVDMAFQGAYPEYAEEALALKKLLLPGYENDVTLQHSCTVASRQLLNILMDGEGPSGMSSQAALARLMRSAGNASARSFLLTPDIVGALTKKVDLEGFNYHLAHVAVLQKRAAEAGLFPLSGEQESLINDVQNWCLALGLDARAAAYAKDLHSSLHKEDSGPRCMHELEQACGHFVRGFRGQTELSAAGRIIRKRAAMTESISSGRREEAIYETSAEYMARLALDHHIVNLSGLIRPNERFSRDDAGMSLNGRAVDEAIRRQTDALYASMFGGEDPNDVRLRMDEKSRKQRMFLDDVHRFESHARTMRTLAESTGEAVRLRAEAGKSEERIKAMEADKALIHFTWPHRRGERMKTCDTVFEIESLAKKLSEADTDEGKERLQGEIDKLLESLKGISPFTLASSIRRRKEIPSLEIVLDHMLPRARALNFFEKKTTVDGVRATEATRTLQSIQYQRAELQALQKSIDRSMGALRSQFGKDNIRRIQQTITAGLYKVFAESQQPLSLFSINDEQTLQAVYDQLKTWGVPVDSGLTRPLVRLTLASLTAADGTLKEDILRREAAKSDLDFAGRESANAMKANLREKGASRFSAWQKTRDFINESLLPDERRRAEGVRSLMREASRPGSGFVYDRTRGMVVDSGAVFTPFTSSKSLVNLVSLAHPLSARLRLMHNDSITVSNVGGGCYQVMLKGGLAASLGATMKIAIPHTPLTLVPGGNAGGRDEHGLALTFKSEKDCENFLNAFMNPASGLHRKDKAYDPSLWLCASQVRFIDGENVSADVSLGLMVSLFQQVLPLGFAGSGSASVSVSFAGETSQKVEQNASGETTTIGFKGKVTLAGSISAGVSRGNVYYGSPKTTLAKAASMDLEQRFKIVTGPQGLMPATCEETEYMVGPLQRGGIHDITRALLLPSAVSNRIASDVTFSDAFEKLLRGLPATARLTVHRSLKPEVLEETRRLFMEARMAMRKDAREAALKKAHELLASFHSYTPTHISIRNVTPDEISRNWSPGLGAFQYARNTSFARIRSGETLSIPLPQGN